MGEPFFSTDLFPSNLLAFLEAIHMPAPVIARLSQCWAAGGLSGLDGFFTSLLSPDTAPAVDKPLLEAAGDAGWPGVLTVHLVAALYNERTVYRDPGIPHSVFIDTMKCFSRFVGEHRLQHGDYGYDRSFWTYRQVCGLLFRLGALEFEMTTLSQTGMSAISPCPLADPDGKILSVHIPSDALLTREALSDSYRQARAFFPRYFPDYGEAPIGCASWLLSPALKALLPSGSGILRFQSDYDVRWEDPADDGAVFWVFRRPVSELASFPEDTFLRRSLKALMLAGGHPGTGAGFLRARPEA